MNDPQTLALVALVVATVAVLVVFRRAADGRRYPAGALPYTSRGRLLSRGEQAFFHVLRAALPPGLMVAPKVRVSDILKCDNAAWKQGFGGRISQKHVDFVVVDARTTEFLLVVELDDRTHGQRDRRERDDFLDRAFAAAEIEVLHVQAAASYDAGDLRALLTDRIAPAAGRT